MKYRRERNAALAGGRALQGQAVYRETCRRLLPIGENRNIVGGV